MMPSSLVSHHTLAAATNLLLKRQIRNHSASITATTASSATASLAARRRDTGGDGDGDGGEFGTAGRIFFSSLCLFTFGLGVWQTQRYFEKVDMVQTRKEDLKLDPFPNYYDWVASTKQKRGEKQTDNHDDNAKTISTSRSGSKSYRRVYLRGIFQHEHEIFIGPRGPPPGALAETGPNSGRGGGGGGMSSGTQGYLVVTPFVMVKDENATKHSHASKREDDVVWINRGWIPRHFLNHPKAHHRPHHPHHGPQSHDYNAIITSYTQPTGILQILAMESNTDTPGRFAPPSRVESSPHRAESKIQTIIVDAASTATPTTTSDPIPMSHKQLLWMDRPAMEELTSCQIPNYHPPLFVEINTSHDDSVVAVDKNKNASSLQYPVKSTQEYVGEFKVTPEIHAAYAITWFGLSGAGMIMTKKLLSRGRR